jgi:hypothetical protein
MDGVDEDLQGWSMDSVAVAAVAEREASAKTSLWAFLRPPYTSLRHAFVLDNGNFSIAVEE